MRPVSKKLARGQKCQNREPERGGRVSSGSAQRVNARATKVVKRKLNYCFGEVVKEGARTFPHDSKRKRSTVWGKKGEKTQAMVFSKPVPGGSTCVSKNRNNKMSKNPENTTHKKKKKPEQGHNKVRVLFLFEVAPRRGGATPEKEKGRREVLEWPREDFCTGKRKR